ncbi:deoxyuridine 5'-triphosphate nucleotidohydrolase [Clostridium ihumii]|uniref:deoxyuridine 5'-triphosphate nucleotidohydrolase n=1 Tax=Clostridium ihumii TaxID=1470356 RepID=UPI003D337BE8
MNKRTRGFELISENQFEKDFQDIDINYSELKLPKRATARAAGYDIYSTIDFKLEPGEDIKLPTGFKAYMLEDESLELYPRSSMGFKYYIRIANTIGLGDSDYYNCESNEGHYFIKLRNEGSKTWEVKKGDAIAQGVFRKYLLADNDDFIGEERVGGFGSTNK